VAYGSLLLSEVVGIHSGYPPKSPRKGIGVRKTEFYGYIEDIPVAVDDFKSRIGYSPA
jgi:hypothetical protein